MASSFENVGTPQNMSTRKQTHERVENLMNEMELLRSENTILKGRLRGIETLGALLQEARESNQKLIEQREQLQQRLDESLLQKHKEEVESGDIITSLSHINLVYQPDPTDINPENKESTPTQPKTFGAKISVGESGIASNNTSVHTEETNNETNHTEQVHPSLSQVQPTDSMNDQDLQFDSDKFEDGKYFNSEDMKGISLHGSSFSCPSTGLSTTSTSNTSHCVENIEIPPSFTDNEGIQSMATGEAFNASKVQEMITMMNNILKEREKLMGLNQFITNQNVDLKKEMTALREGNAKLLHRILQLEHRRDNIDSESLTSAEHKEWVHIPQTSINTETFMKTDKEGSSQSPGYFETVKQLKALKNANKSWQIKWSSLEKQYSNKTQTLEKELDLVKRELSQMQKTHEENQLHADERLLNVKKRVQEEEEAKIEAETNLGRANQEISQLKLRIDEQESELSDLKRNKSIVESELTILKNTRSKKCDEKRDRDKDTDIAVLKQQITICTEDFERERQDRAAAQSARSIAVQENQQLIAEKQNLTAQVNRITTQLQDREMKIRQLKNENENHLRHIQTLQAEIQRLRGQIQASQINREANQINRQAHQIQNIPPSTITSFQYTESRRTRFNDEECLEHLPGAWTCSQCTFINYPGRTVCEACGYITASTQTSYNNLQELQPRGLRDLEIDA